MKRLFQFLLSIFILTIIVIPQSIQSQKQNVFDLQDYSSRIQGFQSYNSLTDDLMGNNSEDFSFVSPKGGEVWKAGIRHHIFLNIFNNNVQINVEFSSDNGVTWEALNDNIGAGKPNQLWESPEIESQNCLLRVIDINNPENYTVTPSTFTLTMEEFDEWKLEKIDNEKMMVSFDFIDDKIGFASGSKVWKTTDGGQSWDELIVSNDVWPYLNVDFFDINRGLIIGELDGGIYQILRTTDGGQNWVGVYNYTSSSPYYPIQYIDENFVVIQTEGDTFIFSEDTGQSWDQVKMTTDLDLWRETNPNYELFFNDIHFIDQQNAWAAGYNLYKSSDGGINWELAFNGEQRKYLYSIDFTSEQIGYAMGQYVIMEYNQQPIVKAIIMKTTDGGQTWFQQDVPPLQRDVITTAEFVDDNNGVAGGILGAFYTTSNGGSTWNLLQSPTNCVIVNIEPISVNHFFAYLSGASFMEYNSESTNSVTNRITIGDVNGVSPSVINVPVSVELKDNFSIDPYMIQGNLSFDQSKLKYLSTTTLEGQLLKDNNWAITGWSFLNGEYSFIATGTDSISTDGVLFEVQFEIIDYQDGTDEISLDPSKWLLNKNTFVDEYESGTITYTYSGETSEEPGDANLDGKVDVHDMVALIHHLHDQIKLHNQSIKNSDVNKDGKLSMGDVIGMALYLAHGNSWDFDPALLRPFTNAQLSNPPIDTNAEILEIPLSFYNSEGLRSVDSEARYDTTEYTFVGFEESEANKTLSNVSEALSGKVKVTYITTSTDNQLEIGTLRFKKNNPLSDRTGIQINYNLNDDMVVDSLILNTQITDIEEGIINEYRLYINYPNPFNPTTLIRYSIPQNEFVTLKVYDVLGNEVAKLVSEQKTQGDYEITFDASNLSSGVYFYRLETSSFAETKKMLLIK